jgi:hypothetical protein
VHVYYEQNRMNSHDLFAVPCVVALIAAVVGVSAIFFRSLLLRERLRTSVTQPERQGRTISSELLTLLGWFSGTVLILVGAILLESLTSSFLGGGWRGLNMWCLISSVLIVAGIVTVIWSAHQQMGRVALWGSLAIVGPCTLSLILHYLQIFSRKDHIAADKSSWNFFNISPPPVWFRLLLFSLMSSPFLVWCIGLFRAPASPVSCLPLASTGTPIPPSTNQPEIHVRCHVCRALNIETAKFCNQCGTEL